jgi:hypothetical protein
MKSCEYSLNFYVKKELYLNRGPAKALRKKPFVLLSRGIIFFVLHIWK